MKKLLLTGLACALLAGCGAISEQMNQNIEPVFKSETDRFTGQKKANWIKLYNGSVYDKNLPFDKIIAVSEIKGEKQNLNLISLTKEFKEWTYLKCHSTAWLVDGRNIKPISSKIDTKVLSSPVRVRESIDVLFTNLDMKKLAKANKIEYRVCNDEFQLSQEELDGLKKVVNSVY